MDFRDSSEQKHYIIIIIDNRKGQRQYMDELRRKFPGGEFFDEIRENGSYYVDKTNLIYELIQETNSKVSLFTRPRRFGKTLMMSMLQCFFDINRSSKALFDGLDISKHQQLCSEWMNQYPTLFVTLKDVDGASFGSAYEMLQNTIADLCKKYATLEYEENVLPADAEIFHRLMYKTADQAEIQNALRTIMRMMSAVYKKPVILLIDEYDVPLAKAHSNGYYRQMLEIIRSLLGTALKSNDYLKFSVVTCCLRIAKESIFTGVNNFKSYSVLDRKFSTYFGFTEAEVEKLLEAVSLHEHMETIRSWYDGYVFGQSKVFCPWDVVNYVADAIYDPSIKPKNYWKNTSSNDILLTFVNHTDFDVRYKFEILLNDGSIRQTISDELTYESLYESEENLWSVLLMTGYITKADPSDDEETISLKIPNMEISRIFEDTVAKYFKQTHNRTKQKELMDALWNGNCKKASDLMTDILFETISYHDYHENYYHAFLTGIIYGAGYDVSSNQENGLGRTDITVREASKRRGMILEAKKSDRPENMEKDCLDGKQQIIDKQYLRGFIGFQKVICYGIAFFQKQALIRKLEL